MIIGCDFDGTLVVHKFPAIGETIPHVLQFIKEGQAKGNKFILMTCRGGKSLEDAIEWCKANGIPPDAVNEDVEEVKNSDFGREKSSKPFANIYIDDRAVSPTQLQDMMFFTSLSGEKVKVDGQVREAHGDPEAEEGV